MPIAYNYGFGQLNPIETPAVGNNFYPDGSTVAGTIKSILLGDYKSPAFQANGPLKAVCLRVEVSSLPPPGSWIQGVAGNAGGAINDKYWISVKARIPELHAHLPDPMSSRGISKACGESITDMEYTNTAMNMHPTFVSKEPVGIGSIGEAPTSGDIIYVDFGDRVNFTQPIYMGKVSEGDIRAAGTGRAKELFGNATFVGEDWTMEAYTPDVDFKSTEPTEPCYKDKSGKTKDGRQCYIDVLAEVDPRRAKYQPRFETTKGNFKEKKATFCNWYVHDVMLALGLEPGKHWVKGKTRESTGPILGMTARWLWQSLKGNNTPAHEPKTLKAMGWKMAPDWKTAQKQANKGNPVIAGWDDRQIEGRRGLSGHVAMLRPGTDVTKKEQMTVADAGGKNELNKSVKPNLNRWKLYAYYELVDKKLK